MNNTLRFRTLLTVSVNVTHNVVTHELFTLLSNLIVDVVLISFELINLLLCNRQTELHLRLSESDPQLSPGSELLIW